MMEDKGGSPEITISVMPNSNTENPSTNPDEQPPMEHFEEEAVGEFAETMMQNAYRGKFAMIYVVIFVKFASWRSRSTGDFL